MPINNINVDQQHQQQQHQQVPNPKTLTKKKPQPTNKPEMKKRRPKLNQPTKLNQRLA